MKTLKLDHGGPMPAFGLGTWKSDETEVTEAVIEAIRSGYRHLDCAWIYGNEGAVGEGIGRGLESGALRREELFVTSKLWNDRHAPQEVEPALRETLDALGLVYLDLYLMHWPVAQKKGTTLPKGPDELVSLEEQPLEETWRAMSALVDAGLCRAVGVSNFSASKLKRLVAASTRTPAVNQVEMHPYLQQPELLEACRSLGVAVTAYSPLGSVDRPDMMKAKGEPVLLEDATVAEIAKAHDATSGQVLIAWALARGTAVIPKSTNPGRIRENIAACELALTREDMLRLAELERARRYVDGSFFAPEGGPQTLEELWA